MTLIGRMPLLRTSYAQISLTKLMTIGFNTMFGVKRVWTQAQIYFPGFLMRRNKILTNGFRFNGHYIETTSCLNAGGDFLGIYFTRSRVSRPARNSRNGASPILNAGNRVGPDQCKAELPTLLDSLHEKVVGHTGSKELADDCTMLALRRPAADRERLGACPLRVNSPGASIPGSVR